VASLPELSQLWADIEPRLTGSESAAHTQARTDDRAIGPPAAFYD
jgi:hypothetical protein